MVKFTLITLLSLAVGVYSQGATVNTPTGVVECQPTQFTWTGGVAPYFLTLVAPGSPGTVLEDLGTQSGTSFTWTANLAANTAFVVAVKDSTGVQNFSGDATVGAGTSTCPSSSAAAGAVSTTSAGGATNATSVSTALSSATSSASSLIASITAKAASATSSVASKLSSASSSASVATSSSKPNSAHGILVPSTLVSGLLILTLAYFSV